MVDGGALLYPATASMPDSNATNPPSGVASYQQEPPDSQESVISAASSTFSASQLPSSSSNVSTSTTGDVEVTSPPSKVPSAKLSAEKSTIPAPMHARGQNAPLQISTANAPRTGSTAASPMSLESPMTQGFKRTADGSMKGAGLSVENPPAPTTGHKRNKSMDTSRIGELSAQLKTRLSYAMIKVQNGWEKQSLEELEEQTSQQGSPMSAVGRSNGSRLTFDSPSDVDRRRRPSGVSETSDQMLMSPGLSTPSDPSRSQVATPAFWRPGAKPTMHAAVNLITVTGSDAGPMLGPAADINPRRKRRSSASYHPPPLLGPSQRQYYSDLSGLPRTPATPRPGILRMPSQQAEKDAVDTLLFMSSPNNSGRLPHTSTDARAQKANAPARRVMFESQPAPGKSAMNYRQSQVPSSQSVAYYRAEPPR